MNPQQAQDVEDVNIRKEIAQVHKQLSAYPRATHGHIVAQLWREWLGAGELQVDYHQQQINSIKDGSDGLRNLIRQL